MRVNWHRCLKGAIKIKCNPEKSFSPAAWHHTSSSLWTHYIGRWVSSSSRASVGEVNRTGSHIGRKFLQAVGKRERWAHKERLGNPTVGTLICTCMPRLDFMRWNWSTSFLCRGRMSWGTNFSCTVNPNSSMWAWWRNDEPLKDNSTHNAFNLRNVTHFSKTEYLVLNNVGRRFHLIYYWLIFFPVYALGV